MHMQTNAPGTATAGLAHTLTEACTTWGSEWAQVQRYCCTHNELLDDMGHVQETRLQDRREELYMVPVEVQGFEGLVVEGMQQLPVALTQRMTVEMVHLHMQECLLTCSNTRVQDDTGHAREIGLQDRKEELYMVRVEVQGFEGLVVEGMQQLLRRKQVSLSLLQGGCDPHHTCLRCMMRGEQHARSSRATCKLTVPQEGSPPPPRTLNPHDERCTGHTC